MERPGYLRDERLAFLLVVDASHEYNDDVGPLGKDDPGVVLDARDASGLVSDRHVARQSGRDGIVETLTLEDFNHRPIRIGINRAPLREALEQD